MRRLLPWLLALAAALAIAAWWLRRPEAPRVAGPSAPPRASASQPAPRAPGAPPPLDLAPLAGAGEPITVELTEPPAARYADAALTDEDAPYAALVARLGRPEVLYDPALARAAREAAHQQSLLGGLAPSDVVDFLLRSAGAVDRTVEQGYAATSGDGAEVARERLERMLGPAPARVGVGEVWVPGAQRSRVVAVLISRREVEIAAAPRRVEPGETWSLSGVLPRGHAAPSALALRPDGRLEEVPVHAVDRRFTVVVPAGAAAGTLHVSVGAVGPSGPGTLVQLPIEIGRPLPETYSTRLPPDERGITTPEAAEALAFDLLNADRARAGLPLLTRDPRLDAIARAHSADMRDHDFFAHVSPRTGEAGDRLAAARYRARAHAENIALQGSLHAAEAALLASLGHRRNILNADVTHVGIGVAGSVADGRAEWHLTQLFALPVVALDAEAEAARLRGAIAERRRAAGLPPLARDRGLDRVALDHARDAAAGRLDGLARRALDAADRAGLVPGKAQAILHRTPDVASLEIPAEAGDAGYARIGIGILQPAEDPKGMAGVVLLLAADPR